MLQQTTVGTVLNHFEKFIKTYPDLKTLSKSSEEQILISWKGLGYYRRAKNLRHIAIEIQNKFDGKIPCNESDLLSLKGVGKYTANALIAMGNNQRALAVDANLERVLARFYGYTEIKGPKLQSKIMDDFSKQIILNEMNSFSAREFNEALMDLGRVLCQKKKSWCHLCPLAKSCVAFKSREPLSFPREDLLKEKKSFELELLRVVVRDKNKILFYKKNDSEWLAGQWELPTFILRSDDEGLKQYPKVKSKKIFSEAVMFKTSITKYVILNRVLEMTLLDFEKLTQKVAIKYEFKVHNEKLNLSTSSIKSIGKLSQF
jgi:A/G-specific adenine glycosylase